jgi:hypothetical protein
MPLSFVETMSGTLHDETGRPYPLSFQVQAASLGKGRFELTGVITAPPWAPQAEARGTLEFGLGRPSITYALRFTTQTGETLTLEAQKRPKLFSPVRTMRLMPATLREANGRILAHGELSFALSTLPTFLASWLPLHKPQQTRLDVRRRAVARQARWG